MKFSMNFSPLCSWNTVTADALIVIPRSRSRSMSSRICSLNSRSVIAPARMSSRSDRVLLPWSMWAMIEKLRICTRFSLRCSGSSYRTVILGPGGRIPSGTPALTLCYARKPQEKHMSSRRSSRPRWIALLIVASVPSLASADDRWQKLFNGKDLAGWEIYLSKPQGESQPIGVNKDERKVFTVLDDGTLRVSGEVFGVISTIEEFENYHLRLDVKWGERRWPPREDRKRDSGILYHAHGEYGAHGNHWTR